MKNFIKEFSKFTEENIRKKISMGKAIDLMREAFLQLSAGVGQVPVRTVIDSRDQLGRVLFMPSYSSAYGLFGLKMISVFDHNARLNLPIIQGMIMVMDGQTGTPLGLLDAEYLTALRTGAASGLATDLLARKNSEILAIFGSGAQAETQLEGIKAVRPIKEVIVFGKTQNKTNSFCQRMGEKFNIEIHAASAPHELNRADIICAATTSSIPVFQKDHVKKGVHINGIGSYKPTMQEIPHEVIQHATLIVDQRTASLTEAGDIVIPIRQGLITNDHIHAELGEIISGSKKGRISDDQITVFKSVGNAIQDLALAHCMLEKN